MPDNPAISKFYQKFTLACSGGVCYSGRMLTDEHTPADSKIQVVYVNSPEKFREVELPCGDLYVDLETYGHEGDSALNVRTNHPRLLTMTGQEGPVWVIDLLWVPIADVVGMIAGRLLIAHNLAFDLPVLVRHGMPYPKKLADTMLASQVLMAGIPNEGSSLKECMRRFLGMEVSKEHGASDWAKEELTPEQLEYAANDVIYLRELHTHLMRRLIKFGLMPTFELECDLLPSVVAMSLLGVGVDVEQWTERSLRAASEADRLKKILLEQLPIPDAMPFREVGVTKKGTPKVADVKYNEKARLYNETRQWNLGSQVQVLEVFSRVGIHLPNTTYETLVEMRVDHPILDTFVEFRGKEKEATAFGMDWLKHVDVRTRRVYPGWRQMGTDSGRFSCASPNMTQMPRGEARKGIRAFDGNLIVRADFSQVEARVAAKISEDEVLSEWFIKHTGDSRYDVHRFVAASLLEKDEQEVTKAERQIGKSLLFGLLFGMQPTNLRVYCRTNYGVKMTLDEAHTFRDKFFRVFPGLEAWHARKRKTAYKQQDFRTLTGRRRFIPDSVETNRHGVSLNTPVQGTAADMLKMVAVDLWKRRHEFPEARTVALIHDEIMLDVPEAKAEDAGKWLKSRMLEIGNKLIYPIPVDAEVKIGRTWGG